LNQSLEEVFANLPSDGHWLHFLQSGFRWDMAWSIHLCDCKCIALCDVV